MKILFCRLSFLLFFFTASLQAAIYAITSDDNKFNEDVSKANSLFLRDLFSKLGPVNSIPLNWQAVDPFNQTAPIGLAEIWDRLKKEDAAGHTLLFHLPDYDFESPEGPGLRMREIISYFIGKAEVLGSKNHPWVAWGEKTKNTGWFAVHQAALTKGVVANLFSQKSLIFKTGGVSPDEIKTLMDRREVGKDRKTSEMITRQVLGTPELFSKLGKSGKSTLFTTTQAYNYLNRLPPYLFGKLPKITIFHAGPTDHDALPGASERHTLINELDGLLGSVNVDIGHFLPEFLDAKTNRFDHLGGGRVHENNVHPGIAQVAFEKTAQERASLIYISLKLYLNGNIGVTVRNEIGGLLGRQMNHPSPTQPLVIFKPKDADCMEAVNLILSDAAMNQQVSVVNSQDGSFDSSKRIIIVEDEKMVAQTLAVMVGILNKS